MQKVRVAGANNESLPEGLIVNNEGLPTTDPSAFLDGGSLAPLGAPHAPHKGFGLALLIDVLSGALTGSGFAQGLPRDAPGTFLWALDPEAFHAARPVPRARGRAGRADQAGRARPRRRGARGPRRAR
jgi:LDH2 family malate/lactate/ureidoglycolate dehydrogenase